VLFGNLAHVLIGSGWDVDTFVHPSVHLGAVCEAIEERHKVCIFSTLGQPDNVRLTKDLGLFFMGISNLHGGPFLESACVSTLPHINQVVHSKDVGFWILEHFLCQGSLFDFFSLESTCGIRHSEELVLGHFVFGHFFFFVDIRWLYRSRFSS
jgi:hypothetical protein